MSESACHNEFLQFDFKYLGVPVKKIDLKKYDRPTAFDRQLQNRGRRGREPRGGTFRESIPY